MVWYWHGGNKAVNVLCVDGHAAMGVNAAEGYRQQFQDPMMDRE
jgi:prepilin-type processing-associated H-X9-DG protein